MAKCAWCQDEIEDDVNTLCSDCHYRAMSDIEREEYNRSSEEE